MFFSIYPTDTPEIKREIIKQATLNKVSHFFTSLHIPEAKFLHTFVNELKEYHKEYHFTYTADISPKALELLNITFDDLSLLKNTGIVGLRLDYGIEVKLVNIFIQQGFFISFNGSTLTTNILEELKDINIIGWHNFYPRPYTGISASYLDSQNELLRKYNAKLKAFIPGEKYKRAPLHLGLPTLESHRYQNPYVSYLELKRDFHIDDVGIAEGILEDTTIHKIMHYEKNNIITLPIDCLDEVKDFLTKKPYSIRIEQSDYSWRIEETRNLFADDSAFYSNDKTTPVEYGGIYADCSKYGRYKGEVHICTTKSRINMNLHKIGMIKKEYINIVPLLSGSPTIQFEFNERGE